MRWYKTASEWGHGDTLEGQMMQREMGRVTAAIYKLKALAEQGSLDVMSRWRGELRRRILLLPPVERVERMSMHELRQVDGEVQSILGHIKRYSARNERCQ